MARDIDIIPVGKTLFLVQYFRFDAIPADLGFDRYHHVECRIETKDGASYCLAGAVYRPKDIRNVVGERNTKQLTLLLETGMTAGQLAEATIHLSSFGAELSSEEVRQRSQQVADQMAAQRPS